MSDTQTELEPQPEAQAAGDPDAHGWSSNGVDPAEISKLFEQSYPNADIVVEAPTVGTLAPASIAKGTPTEVTITGTKFIDGVSVVWADEEQQRSTFVSATSLKYTAAADMAGSQTVTVRNVGMTSNAVELAVT